MPRLFAGTPWDRPPTCDRCGRPEPDCACPPPAPTPPARRSPASQTARLRLEKRAKGKLVTAIGPLSPQDNDLPALAARLKAHCGTGGTAKDDGIELQGNHLDAAEAVLRAVGYQTRRG